MSTVRDVLSKVWEFTDRITPFLIWIVGLLFIADALFQFGNLAEVAEHPREFVFLAGLMIWTAGHRARRERRRANRLERELTEERDDHESRSARST